MFIHKKRTYVNYIINVKTILKLTHNTIFIEKTRENNIQYKFTNIISNKNKIK